MRRTALRVPLGLQVGAVVALFVAASATLWYSGTRVVEREARRNEAKRRLGAVGLALDERGRAAVDEVWHVSRFDAIRPADWERLKARLTTEAGRVLEGRGDLRGGFFVVAPGTQEFLPAIEVGPRGWPPELADDVETQADAAIRKRRPLLVVEVLPTGQAVAIRTAQSRESNRLRVATWAVAPLEDPLFLDSSARGYGLAAGLALGGIALSLALTINLARTVRRQAAERDRLQADLRRSERLAALGKLLAGVAHEVRNPLAGIRSTVQLWQRGIGPDAESFEDLRAEVDRLEGIVSRLLQFSRADAQELAPGDLNAVVAEAARLASAATEGNGVAVEVDLDPAVPPVAMAPPALIQVFRNLTTNALHAMDGRGTLRLSTRFDPARRTVEARVADTGPGLAPEVLGHLFEPFYTTKAAGTGLGLAIAREIALAHRGDLRASNHSPGAVFTLTLPALDPLP